MARRSRAVTPADVIRLVQPWFLEEPVHRRLLILVEPGDGQDLLWVGSAGEAVQWWAARVPARVEGVDPDPDRVEQAEALARAQGLAGKVTLQAADPADLPHESGVFDFTLVNLFHLPGTDGAQVLKEAGRVAKPLSRVVAIAPAWLGAPDHAEVQALEQLGLRPRRVIEWKDAVRSAGVVELEVEEAALDGSWLQQNRLRLAVRGWSAHGWSGLGAAFHPAVAVLLRLARLRTIGLVIVHGTRWRT